MQPVLDFKELNTPAGQGEVLVLPPAGQLVDLVETNHRMLEGNEFGVLDVSSLDCRDISRQRFHADFRNKLWIVTGHQPEFIHAGVWAKHVVTQRLAQRVNGVAANIIVDHDAAKDVALAVPQRKDGNLHKAHIAFASYRPGVPWELLHPLSQAELADFAARVKAAYGSRYDSCLMPAFFAAAGQVAEPQDWVAQMVAGRRAIESTFGIRLIEARARHVWGGPLLAQMLVDAERFFVCYNESLQEYRGMLHIKGSFHPIPDLVQRGEQLEMPIWAVRKDRPRQRVFVERHGDRVALFAEDDPIGTLSVHDLQRWETAEPALEQGVSAGIRPRALTLTFWARLFLADVFIHGIGGAKYDRITDILIRKYFDIEPPGIACVSATLRLDLEGPKVSGADLVDVRRQLRDLRYNPQKHLAGNGQLASLLASRRELVERSKWLREHEPQDHFQRRDVFDRIHEVNRQVLQGEPSAAAQLEQQYDELAESFHQAAIARGREYYIGLFGREDLQFLCDKIPRL